MEAAAGCQNSVVESAPLMPRLKNPISVETFFGIYVLDELLGEGGAGRVYGGVDAEGAAIALKVLASDRATTDKRRRFKNETVFLKQNKHTNIVSISDHGISSIGRFYVMPRYDGNLRDLMKGGIDPYRTLSLFSQILDGVEAAHLQGVVHRDLKPENILWRRNPDTLAIADFGIARFVEDLVVTTVETSPAHRLANFQYAAPEQRAPGQSVQATADIYALGLMLNEMFTGVVPHGTDYRLIGRGAKEQGFLDDIVAKMLRQAPEERPPSIAEVKGLIQKYQSEAVSLQRLSAIDQTVINASEIDEPLALDPPKLIDFDWNQGQLTLTLDRPVTPDWIRALQGINTTYLMGKDPSAFTFRGDQAIIGAREHEVQQLINYFKTWLPVASRNLKYLLEEKGRREESARQEKLKRERENEEQRLRIRRNIRI